MKRAGLVLHKLTDVELRNLHGKHHFIKQENPVDKVLKGEEPREQQKTEAVNIKREVSDREPERITVKVEPKDCYQEPQGGESGASSTPFCHGEADLAIPDMFAVKQEEYVSQGGDNCSAGYLCFVLHGSDSICQENTDNIDPACVKDVLKSLLKRTECNTGGRRRRHASRCATGKQFKCHFCDFSSAWKKSMQRHLATEHAVGLRFQCQLCGYSCLWEWNMKQHLDVKHRQGKVLNCQYCNFSCISKTYMKTHVLVNHRNGELFECQFCDYSSPRKDHLAQHQAVNHGNMK